MKTYLQDRANWILFIVMFMSLVIIYCSSPKDHTVDEIIIENRLADKVDSLK